MSQHTYALLKNNNNKYICLSQGAKNFVAAFGPNNIL